MSWRAASVRSGPRRRLEQRDPVDDLVDHQQAAGGQLAVTARHADSPVGLDDLAHADDVARLLAEVELVAEGAGDLIGERGQVDDPLQAPRARRPPDDHLEQGEVVGDHLLRLGTLDLHDHPMAVGHPGAMHLGDGAGGERLRVDVGEHVLPRHRQLALHHRHDLGLRHLRHVGLQRGELGDVLRGHQVRPRGEDLAELAEGRPELLERLAQPPRALRVTVEPQQPPGELAGSDRPQRLGDLAGPRAQRAGVGLGVGHRLAGGRVDDHHRAVGEVRDAVGDVAEQELLAPAHPGAAHDDDVGVGPFGGREDLRGDVLAGLHHARERGAPPSGSELSSASQQPRCARPASGSPPLPARRARRRAPARRPGSRGAPPRASGRRSRPTRRRAPRRRCRRSRPRPVRLRRHRRAQRMTTAASGVATRKLNDSSR